MLIGQTVPFTIDFVDKDGNKSVFDGITQVTIDHPEFADLTVNADGVSGICVAKAIGTFTVNAVDTAPTNPIPITPASETVSAGPPVSGAVKFGTPV